MKYKYLFGLVLVSLFAKADVIPDKPHIYVEGTGEVSVAPDQMQISIRIAATNLDVEIAKAEIDAKSNTLINSMFALGIEKKDIATTAVQIRPKYENRDRTNVLVGTEASRQIDITLRDLSRYPEFMAALVAAKISEAINTRFKTSNSDSLLDQASIAALADAKTRAEKLAASQGKHVGEIYSISEFQTRRDANTVLYPNRSIQGQSAPGVLAEAVARAEPFEPGTMKATATVYVVFLLK